MMQRPLEVSIFGSLKKRHEHTQDWLEVPATQILKSMFRQQPDAP